jgi:hypothetical protein
MMSDSEILRLLEDNDKIAFDSLYEKYAPLLYSCIKVFTDDMAIACNLLEKSFIDIWRDIKLYNPVNTILFVWMLRITMKNCGPLSPSTSKIMVSTIKAFRYAQMQQNGDEGIAG